MKKQNKISEKSNKKNNEKNNEKSNIKVIFISSMGGHLNELLHLDKLIKKYDSLVVTEKTKATEFVKDIYPNVEYLRYGTKKNFFKYIWVFLSNIVRSYKIFKKFKPDIIITTGTHTAVPMLYIAKLFGKKTIYIETYANIVTKTLAGRLSEPVVDKTVVQWKSMKKLYKNSEYFGGIF